MCFDYRHTPTAELQTFSEKHGKLTQIIQKEILIFFKTTRTLMEYYTEIIPKEIYRVKHDERGVEQTGENNERTDWRAGRKRMKEKQMTSNEVQGR